MTFRISSMASFKSLIYSLNVCISLIHKRVKLNLKSKPIISQNAENATKVQHPTKYIALISMYHTRRAHVITLFIDFGNLIMMICNLLVIYYKNPEKPTIYNKIIVKQ